MNGAAMGFQFCQVRKVHELNSFRGSRSIAIRSAASEGTESFSSNRYKITIKKPLGLVLEQSFGSNLIYVESLVEGGNAESTGIIQQGDQLISTSGVIYTKEQSYGSTMVKGGQKVVRMNVTNESFDAVLAAIGSHPGHIPVELEFERNNNNSNDVEASS